MSILKNTNVNCSGMYKVHKEPNQTRTPQFPQDIRKTNTRVSFSTRVIPTTSVSRPQLKSNRMGDRVMPNNSQGKKQEVEDHHKNFKFSNNKTSVTACNDSLNATTSNVNFVCVTCGKCVLNENHDICVLHYIIGINSRTRQPIAVPISTRKPKQIVNQSVSTYHKKTVSTDSTIKKPRNIIRKIYEQVSKTCSWWYPKFTPPGYKWKPRSITGNVNLNVSMPLGNASRTANTLEPMTPSQFCDADLEVAFRKSTCYIHDLKGNDLLIGSLATSSQAWLWHRRLSYLNFDTINLLSKNNIVTGLLKLKFVKDHLCSSCELGKAKRKSFNTKTTSSSKRRLQLLHMDLCGPMQVQRRNTGSSHDFSSHLSKGTQAQVRIVRTDKGMEFLNKTLHEYFAKECIRHGTSTAQTPKQNSVVERRNPTFVEVARTIATAPQSFLFFHLAGSNCNIMFHSKPITRNSQLDKTPYHIINGRKLSVKFFHIFSSLCYIVKDGENLDKIKEKDAPPLNIQTTPQTTNQAPTQEPTVTATENIIQTETNNKYAQVNNDEFVNIFSTPLKDSAQRNELISKESIVTVARLEVIHQSPRGIFINQAKYAQEILKKHGMTSCDSIGTPMATKHLDADLSGTSVDQMKYRSMVGALMYLTTSRPVIVHATCYCARYQAKPTEKHLTAVNGIFWYLKDTINMGLWYPKDTGFELTAFLDSDHTGCLDSRKSTSGGIQFLGGDKTQLTDYGFHFDKIPMYCDSKAAIAISCNPVQHSHTKHIDVRYHFIKEQVKKGIVELFFVRTEYQLADLFTKALSEDRFKYLVRRLEDPTLFELENHQEISLNLPDHRIRRRCCSLIPVKSDS
ncbi:retrovirus-related pol polyprotein from transposon TNT 1-94 [Tanacetum coccineum]